MEIKNTIALALSGGGSRGAYTVGVLRYLIETDKIKNVRVLYGTSTGALISCCLGAYFATKERKYLDDLIEIYQTVTDKDILKANHNVAYWFAGKEGTLISALLFGGKSIYDTKPLENLIAKKMPNEVWDILFEAATRKENPIEVGFCTYNIQEAKSEVFSTLTHPNPDILRRAVLASANQPVFMPPVKILDNSKRQYVDGGLDNYNPAEKLFESKLFNDVEQILTISTDPRKIEEDLSIIDAIAPFLERTLKLLVRGVFDSDLKVTQLYNLILKIKDYLPKDVWEKFLNEEVSPELQSFINNHLINKRYVSISNIYPKKTIIMDPLKFDPEKMRQIQIQGYREAKALFED